MSLLVFKSVLCRSTVSRVRRDGSCNDIALRQRSGAKQPYEIGPMHLPMRWLSLRSRRAYASTLASQRLRNLSVPTSRWRKTRSSTPGAPGWRCS